MEHYFYNNDVLNDVKRLNAKNKLFDRQRVEWRKILEGKAIMNDYKCVLRRICDKANETYRHPKRKRGNVTINDPQYRLFLGGLNAHAIAYAAEGEHENGVPVYIRYEDKHGSKGELGHEERRRKTKHCVERLDRQRVGRAQRVEKEMGKFVDVNQNREITRSTQYQNVDVDQDQIINQNVGLDQNRKVNRSTRNRNVGFDQDRVITRLTQSGRGNNNQVKVDCCERDNQVQPIKKEKVQGDNGLLLRWKTDFKDCAAKDRLVRKVKAQSSRKRAHCDADVEILDDDVFHEKLSPFVHSKPFQKWMDVDDVDCHHFGSTSSATDVFREKLMDVLKKPFDYDELKRLGDDVRNGLYFVYYPDLEKKLRKYRYKKGKRLNILRGFLFWLQNVSQQGSFKPWKDGQCIAVEPGPPKISPPPRSSNPNYAKQSKRKILM